MAKPSKRSPNPAAAAVGNYGELAPSPTILKRADQPVKKQAKSERDVNASKKTKTKRTTEKSKKSKKEPKPFEPGIYVTNIPKDLKLTKKGAKFAGRKTLPSLPTIERSREKTGGFKKSGPGARKAKVSGEKPIKPVSIERDKSKKPAPAADRDRSKKLDRDKSKKPTSTDKSAKSQKSKKTKAVSKKQTKPKDTKKSVDRYMVLTKIGEISGVKKKTPKKTSPPTPKRTDEHGSVVVGESLMSNVSPTSFPKQGDGVAPPEDEDDDEKEKSYKSKARSKRPSSKRASKRASKRTTTKKAFKKLATSDVQSTFDFVNSKYGKKTSEEATKRRRIMLAVGAVVVLMLLVFIIVLVVLLTSRGAKTDDGSGADRSTTAERTTTTDLPPFEIAIPMDYATVATTPSRTVAWTPAAKRPILDVGVLKTACGHCWYHPNKYTTNCQSLECHSLELFVGQGMRGQANHSFAFIKYTVSSTRQSSFVPEGAPCLTPGRQKVGVCSGRVCLDIDNPTEVAQFEKLDTNPINGQWTPFGAFNKETKSCLSSNAYYTLASQLLAPKYADMKCSSDPKCFPFVVVFRSCTKQKPSNGGKHCFETETSNNWLRMSAKTSPLIVFACKSCSRDRWPSDKPLDFRPDCGRRFGDEYSCPSAAGDWTTMKEIAGFAVSDFEYCCNGNELGRCILGTCMPFYDG